MSSLWDPYGEEACQGGLRRPRGRRARALTAAIRAMVGSTREPSSEHVLRQHVLLRQHQSIVSVKAAVGLVVDRDNQRYIDAGALGHLR